MNYCLLGKVVTLHTTLTWPVYKTTQCKVEPVHKIVQCSWKKNNNNFKVTKPPSASLSESNRSTTACLLVIELKFRKHCLCLSDISPALKKQTKKKTLITSCGHFVQDIKVSVGSSSRPSLWLSCCLNLILLAFQVLEGLNGLWCDTDTVHIHLSPGTDRQRRQRSQVILLK